MRGDEGTDQVKAETYPSALVSSAYPEAQTRHASKSVLGSPVSKYHWHSAAVSDSMVIG